MTLSRRASVAVFLGAVIALASVVWVLAFKAQLDEIERRGRADLAVAEDRLVGQLQRYRGLAVHLASHPDVRALMDGGAPNRAADVIRMAADRSGAYGTFVVDRTGKVLADSTGPAAGTRHGPHLERALRDGALGSFHTVDTGRPGRPNVRAFAFAAPIHVPGGPPAGAVVVRADVGKIEADWRGGELAVYFTDDLGVVFASNRTELLLRMTDGPREPPFTSRSADYEGRALAPDLTTRRWRFSGHALWSIPDLTPYLPRLALHISEPIHVIEMTGEALIDIRPALRLATLPALATAALCLIFGAALLWLSERRRQLQARLALEAQTSALLETRVQERTAALSAANHTLRREVTERLAAETALRKAQEDLVRAEKLGALGRMSADIAHELNQPLMAIRSFAENGRTFLGKGEAAKAEGNLDRIGDLADRMDRIIRNLRAFAQQEAAAGPERTVDLRMAVDAALDLAAERVADQNVTVTWDRPAHPVLVRGGDVRLGQVVSNLVSNALDAMDGQPARHLTLSLNAQDMVRLTVRDTGTGLAEPDRIFDPFYSTKAPGGAEGLGLGLSISYAIIQSFGGVIRGTSAPSGGAVFTVDLPAAAGERAA